MTQHLSRNRVEYLCVVVGMGAGLMVAQLQFGALFLSVVCVTVVGAAIIGLSQRAVFLRAALFLLAFVASLSFGVWLHRRVIDPILMLSVGGVYAAILGVLLISRVVADRLNRNGN